jgi:hypothetical protein
MIFLIEYDRRTKRTLLFERFKDSERHDAQERRLQIELLRQTHERYFESLPDDVKLPSASTR